MTTLRIQSILYNSDKSSIKQALHAVSTAAELARTRGTFATTEVAYGDCSPIPVLTDYDMDVWRSEYAGVKLAYRHFGANLGSARGHNTLLEDAATDFVLIMNPDVVIAPDALLELYRPFGIDGKIGIVEARQVPVEHPKQFDPLTGDTSWAATACALIPRHVCQELNGFDADTFFLYCDDVDFSWRARLAGYRVVYQPSAGAFHDKRLAKGGRWVPGAAEQYYSAEAALFMSWKWSRSDITERLLKSFRASPVDYLVKAAAAFSERRSEGRLPAQLDPEHRIAQFVADAYAHHRFAIVG